MKSEKKSQNPAARDAGVRRAAAPNNPELALAGALALVAFALYIPSYSNGFVGYDDQYYVTANAVVQKGLTREGLVWAFTTTYYSNWLPVTWLTHMLDCELWGMNAGGHHATSALLHAFNAAVLLIAINRMTGRLWAALAVAALWAVHPLRVESVSWVAERKDVVCATFFMLALLAYAHYCRKPSALGYVAVAACHALGLMSKTMSVTLPCVLLLLDCWPLRRFRFAPPVDDAGENGPAFAQRSAAALVVEKLPLVVLSVVASAWTLVYQEAGGAMWRPDHLTMWQRVANAFVSVPRYLLKIAWPTDLSVFYRHPGTWPAWKVGAAVALVVLLCVAAALAWRRRPYLTVGWFWFLGMLVPVSGVIQAGLQSMADRYTQLPSIGLIVALVWWIGDSLRRRTSAARLGAGLVVTTVLAVLATATVRQQKYWENTLELFTHAIKADPDNWMAYAMVGGVMVVNGEKQYLAGDHESAKRLYQTAAGLTAKSLSLNPTFYQAKHSHAWSLYRLGQTDESIRLFHEAIKETPDYGPNYLNLGLILAQQGKVDEALPLFEEAVRLQPSESEAHRHLAEALLLKGRKDEAIAHLKEALRRDPRNEDARYWLEQATKPATESTAPATPPGK